MSTTLVDDVANMLNDVISSKEEQEKKFAQYIDSMTEEQMKEVLKKVNPYSAVSDASIGDEETVSLSITNYRMDFLQRLVTSSMIGFLMRMLKEYKVPDEVPPVEPAEFLKDPSLVEPPTGTKDPGLISKYNQLKETMPDRVVIYKFLQEVFQFDPDRHVTAALSFNTKDPSRVVPKSEAIGRILKERKNTVQTEQKRKDYEAKYSDQALEARTPEERTAFEFIPPLDTFVRFGRYLDEHYEQYLDIVHTLYGMKPDVEYAVIVYDKHLNKENAKLFKERNMNKVIAPITNIQLNKWALLGPYRENRERVDFFNQHTEVLKEMLDQREKDSHIAADIMKKRIKIKKAKNVEEAGPDDKEFIRYLKKNKPKISSMGAEYAGTTDLDAKDDEDDVKGTVEIDVFGISDGGREMTVHKIYNAIEAPTGGMPVEPKERISEKKE